jgi:hypothetical protein
MVRVACIVCVTIVCLFNVQALAITAEPYNRTEDPRSESRILNHDDRPIGGSRGIELISRSLYGPAQCVTVQRDISYTGAGSALLIHDISNPASCRLLGTVYTAGVLDGICVQENIAYAADGPAGLVTIDVSTPSTPAILGVLDVTGWVEELDVQGNYAFLAAGQGGLVVVDIAEPQNPIEVAILPLEPYCRDIDVSGDYAYISGGASRRDFWIVDISNPLNPITVYHYYDVYGTGVYFTAISSAGQLVYLVGCNGEAGQSFIQIFDVSEPSSPVQLALTWYGSFFVSDVQLASIGSAKYAITAQEEYGIALIDITDPYSPVKIADFAPPGYAWLTAVAKLDVKENLIYAAGDWLWFIDATTPSSPALVGHYDTGNYATNIYGPFEQISPADELCAVAYWANGLQLIDVSNPSYPIVRGAIAWPGHYCRDVHLSTRYKYAYLVLNESYLKICDLKKPDTPREIGSLPTDLTRLFYLNNYVYANGVGFFRIIDVSDPRNPWLTGQYSYGGAIPNVRGMEVFTVSQTAYALARPFAEETGLFVFDVSDPSDPIVLGTCTDIFGHDLYVDHHYAYVADIGAYSPGPEGLAVVSVKNPAMPVLVAYADLVEANGCYVFEDYAFIADDAGLKIVNVFDPENPILVESYDLPTSAYDIHYARGCVYVTAGRCGLYVFRFYPPDSEKNTKESEAFTNGKTASSQSEKTCIELTSPNPTKGQVYVRFEAQEEYPATIKMYDVIGRQVNKVLQYRITPGQNEIALSTENLSSGVYFIHLNAEEQSRVLKVRIVK